MHLTLLSLALIGLAAAIPSPGPYAYQRQQLNGYIPSLVPSVINSLFNFGVAAGKSAVDIQPSQPLGVVIVPASPPKPITSVTVHL